MTIQQRSGRTTEPSGGGGQDVVTEGSPRPSSQRPETEVVGKIGARLVGGSGALNPSPSQTPLPRGWVIEGRLGLEQRRGGLLPCTSPHRTWSRPKCNTFSLSEELHCFLCWSSRCGGARGSPGGRRSDGSNRHSSPGGEYRAWVPAPAPGACAGRRRPGRCHRHGRKGSGQHSGAKARWDSCSRDQRLSPAACPREPRRRRAVGGLGQGCGPAAELELPKICSKCRRFPCCSRVPAAGALPNEWPHKSPSPPCLWHPGLAS